MIKAHTVGGSSGEFITLAVLAVGGQGGGVLTNWIADLATRCGYAVQMTSVAGVAQRTGATIYYVEMAPKTDRQPVFALSPSPGDLDVLIAAELMEAGRAVLRGFVTPDKTTLIASTHRVLAISEKSVPGDGRAENTLVEEAISNAALHSVCFDMEAIASDAGSMISASLFGGLARSGCLPFDVAHYEEVIQASGRGVEASLRAFHGAVNYDPVVSENEKEPNPISTNVEGPNELVVAWQALSDRVDTFPIKSQSMVKAGLVQVVDYQDIDYGREYLDHVSEFSFSGNTLAIQAAKYIANAMCYDDIIRVADLKTRSTRQARLRSEQDIPDGEIVNVMEYFHPRAQEVCGTLPAKFGAWIELHPRWFSLLDRVTNKGRRIRTDGIRGFGLLWVIAALKPRRRNTLRHQYESAHLNNLLKLARLAAVTDSNLAAEIFQCQRLIKGYSDTHVRAQSKFTKVMSALTDLTGRQDAADWLERLRQAALADEEGAALGDTLTSLRSAL
ncbi:MAG: indolepyruvate oxidoreductase subunit beta family protein [Granulosicoccaceae bacterium]